MLRRSHDAACSLDRTGSAEEGRYDTSSQKEWNEKMSQIVKTLIQRKTLTAVLLASLMVTAFMIPFAVRGPAFSDGGTAPIAPRQPMSGAAMNSGFAKNVLVESENTVISDLPEDLGPSPDATGTLNIDVNRRPQNEPSIAINPTDPSKFVGGANDYAAGTPIGGGIYAHTSGLATSLTRSNLLTGFAPFPLLAGLGATGTPLSGGTPSQIIEPPAGTGDMALAYGRTRAVGSIPAGLPIAYAASLGFSFSFCENGVFVYRSFNNGVSWSRPVVPFFAPPRGLFTVVYQNLALNCSIFHDKSYLTVDTTGGTHDGRVYVTWTEFLFAGPNYIQSPIMMAFSDDNGVTFSDPIEVSGFSLALCTPQVQGIPGPCDQDQFSYPVVGSDGSLYVHFFNGNTPTSRDQILVVRVTPTGSTSFSIAGPFKVTDVFDGNNDYPIQALGTGNRQTLCNSDFRVNSAGNIAVVPDGNSNPSDDVLYVVWSDDRAQADQFPFPTRVIKTSPSPTPTFACPSGKATDTDIFIMKSTDGGATWVNPVNGSTTNPLRVNAGSDNDQWFPWVAVRPTPPPTSITATRVDVVYYDRSSDPMNHVATTVIKRSADGGMTFPMTISASDGLAPSNFDNAFFGRGTFIGDYINMAIATNGAAYAAWTGVATGRRDSDIQVFVEF